MLNPIIDKRDRETIEKEIREVASVYLPEWNPKIGEPGWAVTQSFSKMLEDIIKRVNQVPNKLFIDFLDKLDFKLYAPLVARVPITFTLAEGTKENKTILKHTQIADKNQVLFETEKNFTVTVAKLKSIFNISSDKTANLTTSSSIQKKGKLNINDFSSYNLLIVNLEKDINAQIDFLFYNDIPLFPTLTKSAFYPFGKEPKLYDSFYIASSNIFSKKGLEITFNFTINNSPKDMKPIISWEYWSGKSWQSLAITYDFLKSNSITLESPNIEESEVNGETNYWIRARLISGGYGTYSAVKGSNQCCDNIVHLTNTYATLPIFKAPLISEFSIKFDPNASQYQNPELEQDNNKKPMGIEFQSTETFNEKTDLLKESKVEITTELRDELPNSDKALYLGFDKAFGEGFISLLFTLPKKYWNLQQYLEWNYYSDEGWQLLNVKDGTNGFIETGTCEFIAPMNQISKTILNKKLFWIQIKIVENQQEKQIIEKQIEINGIYLNSIWATQSKTIKEEYIGSSDGSPKQHFKLLRPPVKNLQIWVRESIEPGDTSLTYTSDKEKGFWVLWSEIAYIYDSNLTARVYTLDPVSGDIYFGNGIFGLIPPLGRDNIKVEYQTGGGKQGNVSKKKIKNLISSISSIDKIENHIEASGGSDEEKIENLIHRAPKTLKNRSRAITFEDYETLTMESSTDVAKVKAIPNFNNGQYQTNWVSVVITPYSQEKQPKCSEGLIKNVKSYLSSRSPITTNIEVISAQYALINLDIDIVLNQWDLSSIVKDDAEKKLTAFLHPIYGGHEKKGWNFGHLPCYSDFYSILEKIDGISYIKSLRMTIIWEENGKKKQQTITDSKSPIFDLPPYILTCSGLHNIKPSSQKEGV